MKIVDAEYLGERGEYRYWQFKVVDGEKVLRIGASLLRTFWSLCDQVRGRSSHARQRRQPRTHRISGVIAMTAWNDFNDADSQQSGFDLIPKGTVVPVRMTIKPGGYDDPEQGWGGGYATESFETGSIYLAAEFVVTAGDHVKRKMWSNVGLLSKKGPTWGQMGRSFIRAALNSARNVHPQDNSPQAAAARRINGFAELDGLEFLARVDIEKDGKGQDRNVVKVAVEPDHPDYAKLMGVPPKASGGGTSGAPAQAAPAYQAPAPQRAPVTGKPSWAQ